MGETLKKDKFLSELSKDILNHILKNNFLTLENMALEVSNITDFQKYFDGVMGRADHHADKVNEIILAIVGGVVWRSNGRFKVREYNGTPANMLWMEVDDKRYCFKYKHGTGNIEVCEGSHNGAVIKVLNNYTILAEVKAFFEGL